MDGLLGSGRTTSGCARVATALTIPSCHGDPSPVVVGAATTVVEFTCNVDVFTKSYSFVYPINIIVLGKFLAPIAAGIAASITLALIHRLAIRESGELRPLDCVECGYDLTANVSGRCPECGKPIPAEQRAHLEKTTSDDAKRSNHNRC